MGALGQVESRTVAMGITVPDVVMAVGAYVPALREGDLGFTSGQVPVVDGAMAAAGQVGEGEGLVSPAQAKELAAASALNAIAAVKSVIGDLDLVTRVVKVVGFVASDPAFTGQPGVVNGASELLGAAFGDAGVHARSAVGVAALPLGASVEVEIVVSVAPRDRPGGPLCRA